MDLTMLHLALHNNRMEEALIEMRKRNDELVRANRDATDSPASPRYLTTNEQVLQLKDEMNRREVAHNERIVEMVCTISHPYTSENKASYHLNSRLTSV